MTAPLQHVRAEFLRGTFPTVVTAEPLDPPWEDRHERAWRAACAANPRLHDGPIWSVVEATAGTLTVQLARYRYLAVQDDPSILDLGARHLGVKALTVAQCADGEPHVLIARRGWRVRTYANAWETAPAGGVSSHGPLTEQCAAESLVAEAKEELGMNAKRSLASLRFVALLHDPTARSVELVAVLPWPGPLDPHWTLPVHREEAWEYSQAKWLALDEVDTFLRAASTHEISPPARWILENARELLA